MSKVRILFLGTPEFAAASLRHLIHDDHFEIVGVVSQPDRPSGRKMQLKPSPVKELALAHGLQVYTPETVNTEEFRALIQSLNAESAAVVAFGQILGQKFLDLFPRGCVNVHGSLLPLWRGAAPIQRSIMAGDTETGVALQIVVRKLDAGPLLGVRRIDLPQEMNAVELHDQLKELGANLLQVEYMDYLRGNLTPVAQDEAKVSLAPKIEKAEAKIDWSESAESIHNKIRGLAMGPFAFAIRSGQPVKFHRTSALSDKESSPRAQSEIVPGTVIEASSTVLRIQCGQGYLNVLEIQPESRAKLSIQDYLRGYPMKVGERFE